MKSTKLILGAFLFLFTIGTSAQVSVNVNIGGGSCRPNWYNHYDNYVEYVYLPEIECYYDMHNAVYVFYGPDGWCRSRMLPDYCHGYDINRGIRVVLDYRGRSPWDHFDHHRNYYWRDNYRYYRNAYNPCHNRRDNYVEYSDNHHYYKQNRGNAYGHYKKHYDYRRNDGYRGNDNNQGNGHGRGHGRR